MYGRFPLPARLQSFVRTVIASVRHPYDVQLVRRIIQLKTVFHLLVHYIFFVECRNEEGNFRQVCVRCRQRTLHRLHEKLFQLDKNIKHNSIAQIGVEHNEQGNPENNFKTKGRGFVHNYICLLLLLFLSLRSIFFIRLCPNSLTVRFASGHLFDSFLQLRLFIRIFQHIHKVVGVCFGRNICRIRFISFHEILGVFRQVFPAVDI